MEKLEWGGEQELSWGPSLYFFLVQSPFQLLQKITIYDFKINAVSKLKARLAGKYSHGENQNSNTYAQIPLNQVPKN